MPDPKTLTTQAERLAFWLDRLVTAGDKTVTVSIAELRVAIEDAEGDSDMARRLICGRVIAAARGQARAIEESAQPKSAYRAARAAGWQP